MSEQVQITMPLEVFTVIHGLVVAKGQEAIRAAMFAQKLGMLSEEQSKRALREIECLSVYLTYVPIDKAPVRNSPAPIYAIAVKLPEDSPEYQAQKLKAEELVRLEMGLAAKPKQ